MNKQTAKALRELMDALEDLACELSARSVVAIDTGDAVAVAADRVRATLKGTVVE